MQRLTDTWKTAPRHKATAAGSAPCLVYIYPAGPAMGQRYALGTAGLLVGRDPQCEIYLEEPSVSRSHARVEPGADGFSVSDLGSTNGTFVNEAPASRCVLRDGDYLRVGNCIFRFLAGGNVEAQYHEEIYRLTVLDALTGIANKRFLLESLERELARSTRHRRPLALVLFDVDHFKAVNDRLGHLGGDYTLRELAGCVREVIRRDELFARYGGEEFVVLLPETDRDGAVQVAERLRQKVEAHPFTYQGQCYQVTISLGVFCTGGEDWLTAEELLGLADYNLYQAKRAGRNRLVA